MGTRKLCPGWMVDFNWRLAVDFLRVMSGRCTQIGKLFPSAIHCKASAWWMAATLD
jgi:hypothetical protein